MSDPLSETLNRAWYGKQAWVYLLFPFSILYWCVVTFRKKLHAAPSQTKLPVIVVGNITLGGTGKSPLVACLVRAFQSKGYKVGIVSRGYGADIPNGEVRLVSKDSPASCVGDEPLMLKRALGCDIALCPTRPLAVQKLESLGCELVIADDGLQHYAMYRDIEICVVDAERGLGNAWVLPVGPLREPASRIRDVDFIVLNGRQAEKNNGRELPTSFEMSLNPVNFEHLETGEQMDVTTFVERHAEQPATAVAAIGNPQRFFSTIEHLGLNLNSTVAFADHHSFSWNDFDHSEHPDRLTIMTEKDAVKCKGLGLKNAWFLRVRPELQDNFIETIYNRLIDKKRLSAKT